MKYFTSLTARLKALKKCLIPGNIGGALKRTMFTCGVNKGFHYPVILMAIFYALGIGLAEFVQVSIVTLFLGFGLVFLLCICLRERRAFDFIIILLFLLCGALRMKVEQLPMDKPIAHFAKYNRGQTVRLVGTIISDVTKKEVHGSSRMNFTVLAHEIEGRYKIRPVNEKVLVKAFKYYDLKYGDKLLIEGKLHKPFNFANAGRFSYEQYLSRRSINWICSVKKSSEIKILQSWQGFWLKSKALELREGGEEIFKKYLSAREASILEAIIFGNRAHIPNAIRGLFVQTGTVHILAISGLHVGIISSFFLMVIKILPINRKMHYWLTIGLLLGYLMLTGARPSVIRATIMAIVFLGSFIVEKRQNLYNSLSFAALILLIYNPNYLFDIGFQLSFICVLTILVMAYIINSINTFKNGKYNLMFRWFLRSFGVSIGLWMSIAGIIAYYFQIITPISILANLVVIPLLGVVISLSLGLLISALISAQLALIVAAVLKVSLNVMVGFIKKMNDLPFAYINIENITFWHLLVYYFAWALILISFLKVCGQKNQINIAFKRMNKAIQ